MEFLRSSNLDNFSSKTEFSNLEELDDVENIFEGSLYFNIITDLSDNLETFSCDSLFEDYN